MVYCRNVDRNRLNSIKIINIGGGEGRGVLLLDLLLLRITDISSIVR